LTLLLLLGLAFLAGAHPVRFSSLRVALTATHPVVLCCVALVGPWAAALAALAGMVGSIVGSERRPAPIRLAFNLGAVVLAAAAASGVFALLGGLAGASLPASLGPLVGATTAYFLANSGLVSLVAALEKKQGLMKTWRETFPWIAASYFMGLSLAAGMLFVLERLGPWGLLLALPPAWLILSFYRAHQDRLNEKQQRIDEVEALNAELRETLNHVKRLQGLLPICMHCKSVRDDGDAWHRIEAYLEQHSEAQFTHSVCDRCREEHYPLPVLVDSEPRS
jgi:hypothetical protein